MSSRARAVVLGGSVAGLCAAGVLAQHFDEVVVLERDTLPADAQHRRGVPQSKHPHFLLNSGRRAMERIFPGYEAELIAAGGLHLMPSMAAAHCEEAGWVPRRTSSMTMIYGSRVLIERVLRDKLRALPNVAVREGTSVVGIETTGGGRPDGRVTGAWILNPSDGEPRLIVADLVIDALGRGSSVGEWLHAAGWPEVPVHTLDANVTYTSRWYRKPAPSTIPDSWWWDQLSVMPTSDPAPHPPEHDFLCQIFPIEDDRVIVTMGSWGHPMPRRNDDFVAAAERVRAPAFADAMHRCEPLSDVFLTRSTGNKWRRYDLLDNPPLGLIAIGDSICGFNPFYAQGMSSAARSAVLLADKLNTSIALDRRFYRRFLREQRDSLNVAWSLAVARDQGYERATGTDVPPQWRQRLAARLSWPLFNLISGASREDAVIEQHFAKVFNLDESIADMSRSPRVLFGLARFGIKRALNRTTMPVGFDYRLAPPGDVYDTRTGQIEELPRMETVAARSV